MAMTPEHMTRDVSQGSALGRPWAMGPHLDPQSLLKMGGREGQRGDFQDPLRCGTELFYNHSSCVTLSVTLCWRVRASEVTFHLRREEDHLSAV